MARASLSLCLEASGAQARSPLPGGALLAPWPWEGLPSADSCDHWKLLPRCTALPPQEPRAGRGAGPRRSGLAGNGRAGRHECLRVPRRPGLTEDRMRDAESNSLLPQHWGGTRADPTLW